MPWVVTGDGGTPVGRCSCGRRSPTRSRCCCMAGPSRSCGSRRSCRRRRTCIRAFRHCPASPSRPLRAAGGCGGGDGGGGRRSDDRIRPRPVRRVSRRRRVRRGGGPRRPSRASDGTARAGRTVDQAAHARGRPRRLTGRTDRVNPGETAHVDRLRRLCRDDPQLGRVAHLGRRLLGLRCHRHVVHIVCGEWARAGWTRRRVDGLHGLPPAPRQRSPRVRVALFDVRSSVEETPGPPRGMGTATGVGGRRTHGCTLFAVRRTAVPSGSGPDRGREYLLAPQPESRWRGRSRGLRFGVVQAQVPVVGHVDRAPAPSRRS